MTRSTGLLVLGFLSSLLGHGLAAGNAPALDPKEGTALVRQLGDESFATRQEASRKLMALGLAARDVLLDGMRSPDPEIRKSCRLLLPAVLRADRQARLEAFIADKEGKKEHDLPGWKRFRKVVGADAAARDLFVSMQRSTAVILLSDVDKNPKLAGELLQSSCQQLWTQLFFRPGLQPRQPTVAEVAALYLVATDPEVKLAPNTVSQLVNFLNQPSIQTAFRSNAVAVRKLVVGWMMQQIDDTSFQQIGWTLVQNNLNLPEVAEIGLKVIRGKKAKAHGLALALAVVGKHGKREHAKEMEQFLNDRTLVGNVVMNNQRGTTEVRDVALAMMVHLTGQQQKDYGFPFLQQNNAWLKFHYHFMGFSSDAQRDQALRKWKSWQASQKK